MNIYMISPNPLWGGAASANLAIARMLSQEHKVYYNDEYNIIDDNRLYYDDFPVHQCKDSYKFVSYVLSLKVDAIIWGIAMNVPYYIVASKLLKKNNIKQYVLFHSLTIINNFKGMLMEWMVSKSMTYVDYLVFVSKYTDISWSRYRAIRHHPNHLVIYNPIELNYNVDVLNVNSINRLGFVGRFSAEKQPEFFARLSEFDNNENTYIAWGDGELLQRLKEKYKSVRFMGHSIHQEKIYQSFDILIMTSKFENCPMVILEARKYGIPCVVPNVGGMPEIVQDGYNGILYNDYSEDSILSCVDKIKNNYVEFRNNCINDVKNYSFESLINYWNKILK